VGKPTDGKVDNKLQEVQMLGYASTARILPYDIGINRCFTAKAYKYQRTTMKEDPLFIFSDHHVEYAFRVHTNEAM
jgi:hypothetical protein